MNQDILNLLEQNSLELKLKEEKYFYNGVPVPRVTEIISKMISEEYLMYWSNSLGFKRISRFLLGETFASNNIPYLGFRKWWIDVNSNNTIKVLGSEQELVCPYFGGTYDLLLEINGLVYLVDFKTSNHVSYKYYLQLAAYKYMLELKGYNIAGCIILQLNKEEIQYTEYPLIFSNPDHLNFINASLNTFLSLVYSYYNIYQCERMYKQIF